VTEIVEVPNRGHAFTIDCGWREVADTVLALGKRFTDLDFAARKKAQDGEGELSSPLDIAGELC
jgi:hypothetical protein